MNYSKEFEGIVKAYELAGGNKKKLIDNRFGSLIINANRVLGKNEIPGIKIQHRSLSNGVKVKITVEKNTIVKNPVHLCFGMLPSDGKQVIKSAFIIGKRAKVKFIAHCVFPNARHIEHVMDAEVRVSEDAEMSYTETHYHSESGGTYVYPRLRGLIKKGGRLFEEFKLTQGRAGLLDIDYEVEQGGISSCKLLTKVHGKSKDRINIREALHLNGSNAAGIAKTRCVLTDNAEGNVLGEILGNAAYTRGHFDCQEMVYGNGAKATSTPRIIAAHPLARITHEAAIGRINKKEIETLMARGLGEDEAVEFIVRGLLR